MRRLAYAELYRARAALGQATPYPDATATLRLSYGTVAGVSKQADSASAFTNMAGFFAHAETHGNEPPYRPAQAWLAHKARLDLATPLNFTSTTDILGGNSGSPVVNRQGEIVGVIFDGNADSLAGRYLYDASRNRAIAVDTAAINEALRKIYGAEPLAAELENGRAKWTEP